MSSIKPQTKTYFEINKSKTLSSSNINFQKQTQEQTHSPINMTLYNHIASLIPNQEIIENYKILQKNIISIRGNIIDWLLLVADKINISQETFFKTIVLLDKYISMLTVEITDPEKIHFIAVICFFIAFKFEETGAMNLEFLEEKLLHNKYSRKEIVAKETEILLTLNFKLNFPSVNTFSNIIIENLKQIVKDDIFLKQLDCIYNFVNKISLFVDEFIFGSNCFTISLINLQTAFMLMKGMKLVNEESVKVLENNVTKLTENFVNTKQINILASGLHLAIINQENQGCHKKLFQSYYSGIEETMMKSI